jgi:hypothetical protein
MCIKKIKACWFCELEFNSQTRCIHCTHTSVSLNKGFVIYPLKVSYYN